LLIFYVILVFLALIFIFEASFFVFQKLKRKQKKDNLVLNVKFKKNIL